MARKPREYGSSGIYHVILRGNNKQNIFNDDNDRIFFLNKLKKYTGELGIVVYAYCLMNNHVHLLIGNATRNMPLLVQKIANSYVFYFNRKYDRCGHLFQGRYKSEPVCDDSYFKVVYRYILHNCEKAGLDSFDVYEWSSYKALIESEKNAFVNVEYVIGLFGSKYELFSFLNQRSKEKCMEYENLIVLTDGKAFELIKKLFNIRSPYFFERLELEEQVFKCNIMKKYGLSTNQISRITGISKSIIRKSVNY